MSLHPHASGPRSVSAPDAAEQQEGLFPPWRVYPIMGFELTFLDGVHRVAPLDKRTYPGVFLALGALGLGFLALAVWIGSSGGIWYDKLVLGTFFIALAIWGNHRIRSGAPLRITLTSVRYRSLLGHRTAPLSTISGFSTDGPTHSYAGRRHNWTVSIRMHRTDGSTTTVLFGITPLEDLCPDLLASAQELTAALNGIVAKQHAPAKMVVGRKGG